MSDTNTKLNFTPGSWSATNRAITTCGLFSKFIGSVEKDGCSVAERTANARLFAAAPSLLYALDRILDTHHGYESIGDSDFCLWCGNEILKVIQGEVGAVICGYRDCIGTVARQAIDKALNGGYFDENV